MARERRRRRGGSAEGPDAQTIPKAPAYIKRKIPHYSILSDEDLSIIEDNADTTKPLYKAFITFLLLPSFTKKVPKIDVRIHAPPIVRG